MAGNNNDLWHVNPKTGKKGKCGARKRKCPFGADNHFRNEADADKRSHEIISNLHGGEQVLSKSKGGQSSDGVGKPITMNPDVIPDEQSMGYVVQGDDYKHDAMVMRDAIAESEVPQDDLKEKMNRMLVERRESDDARVKRINDEWSALNGRLESIKSSIQEKVDHEIAERTEYYTKRRKNASELLSKMNKVMSPVGKVKLLVGTGIPVSLKGMFYNNKYMNVVERNKGTFYVSGESCLTDVKRTVYNNQYRIKMQFEDGKSVSMPESMFDENSLRDGLEHYANEPIDGFIRQDTKNLWGKYSLSKNDEMSDIHRSMYKLSIELGEIEDDDKQLGSITDDDRNHAYSQARSLFNADKEMWDSIHHLHETDAYDDKESLRGLNRKVLESNDRHSIDLDVIGVDDRGRVVALNHPDRYYAYAELDSRKETPEYVWIEPASGRIEHSVATALTGHDTVPGLHSVRDGQLPSLARVVSDNASKHAKMMWSAYSV